MVRAYHTATEAKTLNRASRTAIHAMNEVTIHRGPSSHLIYTDVLVNGQHLTEAVASLSLRPQNHPAVTVLR